MRWEAVSLAGVRVPYAYRQYTTERGRPFLAEDMMAEPTWEAIAQKLRAPFDPADVDWRPQGNPKAGENCQVVCYITARAVMDRLDEVVGASNWAFDYEAIVIANGQVQIAKGRLTLHGVSKEDVGEASSFDPSKGCVSDALKRCAVLWGIGRYLYNVPPTWVRMDAEKRIPDAVLATLRVQLPGGSGRVTDVPVESTKVVQQHRAPTPIRTAPAAKLTPAPSPKATWPSLRLRARKLNITSEEDWRDFVVSATGKVADFTPQDLAIVEQKLTRRERGEEPGEIA